MNAPRAILSKMEIVGKLWSVFGAICGDFPRFGVRFFPIFRVLERIGSPISRTSSERSAGLSPKRKESTRGGELPRNARQLVAERVITSSIFSPSACAARRKTSRRSNVARLLSTLPRSRFSPTRMQPSVSSAVLPLWIRTPA